MDSRKKAVFGIFLILTGLFLLLKNLHMLPELPSYVYSWINILLAISIFHLFSGNHKAAMLFAGLWLFFTLDKYIHIDWRQFWPLILVVAGLSFLVKNRNERRGTIADDYFDDTNILSSTHKIVASSMLQGGKVSCILGRAKLDLRDAKPVSGCTIKVSIAFGGCDLILPSDWSVINQTSTIFASMKDYRQPNSSPATCQVVVKGLMFAGGCEVTEG